MAEPPNPPVSPKRKIQTETELLADGAKAPRASLSLRMPSSANPQTLTKEAKANPFASPGRGRHEAKPNNKAQEDKTKGWSFQGRRRHAPKLASPRQKPHQATPPPRTQQLELTPGGRKGQLHSEVHPSFFTSLGIPTPPDREPLRAKVWPVLSRENNFQKETLVHSKNQARPSLPFNIRIISPAEAEWAQHSA
jgi:hypothetical protein